MGKKASKRRLSKNEIEKREKLRKIRAEFLLIIFSCFYIAYFVNLHFFYDWDTVNLAIVFKEGISIENFDLRHLLVPAMVMCISPFLEPLTAFKVLTIILGILLIYGTFKFSYLETKDIIFAYASSLLILFNFGIVFLLTSLEDNIWMYPFVVLAIYYLFKDKMEISAIFMSLAILIHLQAAVFLIMFILYIYLKHRELLRINEGYINVRKIITAFLCFLTPLSLSYGALALLKGLSIPELISILATSDYRSNPDWWYFSSDRNIIEQIKLVYFGLTSTFVCRYPEFLQIMPQALLFSGIFLIFIFFILIKIISSNKKNIKIICAIPSFLIFFIHSIFYESHNIERWDFLPFFIMYFVTLGYSELKNRYEMRELKQLKQLIFLIVVLSLIFTFLSFYLMSGFTSNPIYDYADKLEKIVTEEDVVLESIRSTSELGLYIRYKLGDKVVFIEEKYDELSKILTSSKNIYCSYYTYTVIAKIIPIKEKILWINNKNQGFNIVKIDLSTH